jgi:hypothetical protein
VIEEMIGALLSTVAGATASDAPQLVLLHTVSMPCSPRSMPCAC